MGTKTLECDLIVWSIGREGPSPLFTVIDFYKDTLRVYNDIILYGWVSLVIEKFFASVRSFCTWGKHFNNQRRVMCFVIFWCFVAWIASDSEIRIDIAGL